MKKKGLIVIIALAAIISADLIFNLTAKRPDNPQKITMN